MKRNAGGFTLIELIVVIVVLGILAATAMPRFLDVKDDAGNAAVAGVAGGLASASAINYAGKMMGKGVTPTSLSGARAVVCTDANMGSLLTSGLPSGYSIAVSATVSCNSAETMICSVSNGTYRADTALTCY